VSRSAAPALILVRHAAPEQDPDVSPTRWRLSAAGRAAAAALADKLADLAPAVVCSSPEPKAAETAEIIARPLGLPVARDPGFEEHRRGWPFETDPAAFQARVGRVLTERAVSIDGAETGEAAAARFAAALGRRSERPLLVVSHGTVLSLHVAAGTGEDAFALWRSLALPEALLLSADGALIGRIA
jgi:probable phosphoglycerate mutase